MPSKAQLIGLNDPSHNDVMVKSLLNGGVIGAIWGFHLYFLACNAFDANAVQKLNKIKGRSSTQVLAAPGAVDEVIEFTDFSKSKCLAIQAKKLNLTPKKYLESLFTKFPLAVELYAKNNLPSSVTFETDNGKTIWVAAHMRDKQYSSLLKTVRDLRKSGTKVMFAGTSLNLSGENTLTVKQTKKVLEDFGTLADVISIHPNGDQLKKLSFSTSCSVVSFINDKPKLIRIGSTNFRTLKKYIPDLELSSHVSKTRKSHN